MKKLLMIFVAFQVSFAMAAYVDFAPAGAGGIDDLADAAGWQTIGTKSREQGANTWVGQGSFRSSSFCQPIPACLPARPGKPIRWSSGSAATTAIPPKREWTNSAWKSSASAGRKGKGSPIPKRGRARPACMSILPKGNAFLQGILAEVDTFREAFQEAQRTPEKIPPTIKAPIARADFPGKLIAMIQKAAA